MLKETTNIVREVAHSAPPAAYVASGLFGYAWNELAQAAIFVFTVLQIIRALPKLQRCAFCFFPRCRCDGSCKEIKE